MDKKPKLAANRWTEEPLLYSEILPKTLHFHPNTPFLRSKAIQRIPPATRSRS